MNEIAIIKGLLALLQPYKVYADELPIDFNFTNTNGCYYILDTVNNNVYKDSYNLEIHLVGLNKINLLKDCESITNKLNKQEPTSLSRIIEKNVKRNYVREEDGKHHFILEYYIEDLGGK